MARDDLFRRSFEAGTAFLDMSRERAEALVKELVKAGDVQKGKAQKVIDDLLERSRKGSEELSKLIRREIAQQVQALGLATKDDVARLEARLDTVAASAAAPTATEAPAHAPPAGSPRPSKAPPVKKAGGQKAASGGATAAAKARSPRKEAASAASAEASSEPTVHDGTGGPPPNGPAEG